MGFLAPIFLAGLAAVAVPIVLHLFRREKPHDYKVLPRVPSHPSSVASRGALVFAS